MYLYEDDTKRKIWPCFTVYPSSRPHLDIICHFNMTILLPRDPAALPTNQKIVDSSPTRISLKFMLQFVLQPAL